jgi:hypothetical protein
VTSDETSVIRKFRITASDGKTYNTNHCNLKSTIAVSNKVDSPILTICCKSDVSKPIIGSKW